ncbi:hypothetical protein J4444_02980 [Candidatus Woesearchaeota archaeon]|nr:hypothetical protein [Candidatus Woesearchaeota archaeon]
MLKKMPVPMIILEVYLILGAMVGLFTISQRTFLFGTFLSAEHSAIMNVLFFTLLVLIIVGIYKRYHWTWELGLVYFGVSIINGLINLGVLMFNPVARVVLLNQSFPAGVSAESVMLLSTVQAVSLVVVLFLFAIIFRYVHLMHKYFDKW